MLVEPRGGGAVREGSVDALIYLKKKLIRRSLNAASDGNAVEKVTGTEESLNV